MPLAVVIAVCAPPLLCPPIPSRPYDDGTELGQAMAVCAQHELQVESFVWPERSDAPLRYEQGFEACEQVRKLWLERHHADRDKALVKRAVRHR